jgi:hypothetical protein
VVLDDLESSELAQRTLVIYTTGDGIAFPQMKTNLTGHGTGAAPADPPALCREVGTQRILSYSPASRANLPASSRLPAWSLLRMLLTWLRTVFPLITSSSAISLFL